MRTLIFIVENFNQFEKKYLLFYAQALQRQCLLLVPAPIFLYAWPLFGIWQTFCPSNT